MNSRPLAADASPYFFRYIDQVPEEDISGLLAKTSLEFYQNIPPEKWNYRYAEGKWTIKEVLIHIIDTERIMAYRALRIGRGDHTALPGFEQDDFVATAKADQRSVESVLEEYSTVRAATASLFRTMDSATLSQKGTASGSSITPNALAYLIVGHEIHHLKVLRERYDL